MAEVYKKSQMVNYMDEEEGVVKQYEICADIDKLGKFGIGIELYFKFLRFYTLVFLLMSCAVAPAIYNNYIGNGLQNLQAQNFLLKATLAN